MPMPRWAEAFIAALLLIACGYVAVTTDGITQDVAFAGIGVSALIFGHVAIHK